MEKTVGRSNVRYSPDVTALERYGNNRLVGGFFATINVNKETGEAYSSISAFRKTSCSF